MKLNFLKKSGSNTRSIVYSYRESDSMNFIVALHPEARPIIEMYGLENEHHPILFLFLKMKSTDLLFQELGGSMLLLQLAIF